VNSKSTTWTYPAATDQKNRTPEQLIWQVVPRTSSWTLTVEKEAKTKGPRERLGFPLSED